MITNTQETPFHMEMPTNQKSNIVLYAFVADALALGPHWIYRQSEIAERAGEITTFLDPMTDYHPGKAAGDLTHYGDQMLVLLRSVAAEKGFSLSAFARDWRAFWENPTTKSYRDGATKIALGNLMGGRKPEESASPSNDIAGAARIAPLFLPDWDSPDDLFAAVRAQTALTHGDPATIEAAEFFARVVLLTTDGQTISDALDSVARSGRWELIPKQWYEAAVDSIVNQPDPLAAACSHGLTCHLPDAFPAVCDLLLRYPEDVGTALAINVQAGGDSAARGMLIGMVHGARPEPKPLPTKWLAELHAREEIEQLLKR